MRLFRRRETLNEKLLREANLDAAAEPARPAGLAVPSPPYRGSLAAEPGVTGLARQREWDLVVTAEAPAVAGDRVAFVALPDGSLLVEDEQGEGQLDELAGAVEEQLQPPYRANGVRQSETVWAVFANAIRVEEFRADGDELELVVSPEGRSLRVDDSPTFGAVPALERIGEQEGSAYVVRASRLDGDLWEVGAAPL